MMPPHNGRAFFMAIINHTQHDLQVHHVFIFTPSTFITMDKGLAAHK